MAVISNIEWKAEEAVLTALGFNVDLDILGPGGASVPRVRHSQNDDVIYPIVTVQATSAHPATYGGAFGIEETLLELVAMTARREDSDAFIVGQILGACRDTVRDASFLAQLNGLVDFTAHGSNEVDFSRVADTNRVRVRGMTIRLLCNVSDI